MTKRFSENDRRTLRRVLDGDMMPRSTVAGLLRRGCVERENPTGHGFRPSPTNFASMSRGPAWHSWKIVCPQAMAVAQAEKSLRDQGNLE